jgi:hypothetical protein
MPHSLANSTVAPVPPALLSATIDYLMATRPEDNSVTTAAVIFATRLDYDDDIAFALALRVAAAARLFSNPLWPIVRRIGEHAMLEQRVTYETTVLICMATSPLDETGGFDIQHLLDVLLSKLPPAGRG